MPKVSEKEAVAAAQKKVSPYKRADAPCTLMLKKKILYRKKEDGTLDHSIQTVSNKWYDGTLVCRSGAERPDIWVVQADVEKGIEHLKNTKQIKYMLFKMKDACSCKGFHVLSRLVREEEAEPEPEPEPEADSDKEQFF